jgi:hypothetical protein
MLWTVALAATAAVGLPVAVAVGKLLLFLLGCIRAKRQFLSSPIPGPPTDNKIVGAHSNCCMHVLWSACLHVQSSLADVYSLHTCFLSSCAVTGMCSVWSCCVV